MTISFHAYQRNSFSIIDDVIKKMDSDASELRAVVGLSTNDLTALEKIKNMRVNICHGKDNTPIAFLFDEKRWKLDSFVPNPDLQQLTADLTSLDKDSRKLRFVVWNGPVEESTASNDQRAKDIAQNKLELAGALDEAEKAKKGSEKFIICSEAKDYLKKLLRKGKFEKIDGFKNQDESLRIWTQGKYKIAKSKAVATNLTVASSPAARKDSDGGNSSEEDTPSSPTTPSPAAATAPSPAATAPAPAKLTASIPTPAPTPAAPAIAATSVIPVAPPIETTLTTLVPAPKDKPKKGISLTDALAKKPKLNKVEPPKESPLKWDNSAVGAPVASSPNPSALPKIQLPQKPKTGSASKPGPQPAISTNPPSTPSNPTSSYKKVNKKPQAASAAPQTAAPTQQNAPTPTPVAKRSFCTRFSEGFANLIKKIIAFVTCRAFRKKQ